MNATPWQVRYVRWWYERQAAWHLEMAKRGRHREYNLRRAAEDAGVVLKIREHWLRTKAIPLVPQGRTQALALMRVPPRLSMLQNYDLWMRRPVDVPARGRAVKKQRRTSWMFRRRSAHS